MQDERRQAVLRAIVEDYVATQEPVGSKALVERHQLGVSPATVRNDMAALEEEGLITQPHTSAGRIPTDKGYRLFVDRLTTIKPMSAAEKRAIATILDGAVDLDDVVQRSVRLLAQLTHQVALVQYPTLSRSTVRHVELVALSENRVLAVLILSSGRVEQRLVELDTPADEMTLAAVRARVAAAVTGRIIAEATSALGDLTAPPSEGAAQARVIDVLVDAMSDHRSSERVAVGGAANLARFGDSFEVSVRPLLEALEEHVVLLKLLACGAHLRRTEEQRRLGRAVQDRLALVSEQAVCGEVQHTVARELARTRQRLEIGLCRACTEPYRFGFVPWRLQRSEGLGHRAQLVGRLGQRRLRL